MERKMHGMTLSRLPARRKLICPRTLDGEEGRRNLGKELHNSP